MTESKDTEQTTDSRSAGGVWIRSMSPADVPAARALWNATEHMGLSAADAPRALRAFVRRHPGLSCAAFARYVGDGPSRQHELDVNHGSTPLEEADGDDDTTGRDESGRHDDATRHGEPDRHHETIRNDQMELTGVPRTREVRLVGALLAGHDGRRGYLYHLAVDPTYRRRGIATRMVNRAVTRLERAGIQRCHIMIYADNGDGQAAWGGMGWFARPELVLMSRDTTTDHRARRFRRE